MIRPLRRVHRLLVIMLALLLPVIIAISLYYRPAPAVQREWVLP